MTKRRRTLTRLAVGILCTLGAGFFGGRTLAVGALVYAPNHNKLAAALPLRVNEERIPGATVGVQLAVEVHPFSAPLDGQQRGTIFILHGMRDHKESLRGWADMLDRAGYITVLVDHRGQGNSTGQYFTYGAEEANDLRIIATRLLDAHRIRTPLGALGASYGAATALRWAELDPRVKAVIALAPFAELPSMIGNFSPVPLPHWFVEHVVDKGGAIAGFDPGAVDSVRSATTARVPLLLLHGRADRHIPIEHSRRICHAARTHCELIELEDTDHLGIFDDQRTHLTELAPHWFASHLPPAHDAARPLLEGEQAH
jgi:alpha-beta hydrolase superfamily lysophospholipase